MTVYIISFFNNIKEREINFYTVVKQYLNLNYKVIVYWMNEKKCLIYSNNLTIIQAIQVNASVARNKLLDLFYSSSEDYAIFSDDDTFLKCPIEERLDCISFNNYYSKEIEETFKISTGLLLISNFKKKYNLKPYFDETLEANQDLDFGLTLNRLGIKTYRKSTDNIIVYKGPSSMFKNKMDNLYKKQTSLTYILNKHGKYNS